MGDGCTPKITGLDLLSTVSGGGQDLSFVSEKQAADYNNYECGRRASATTTRVSASASRASRAKLAPSRLLSFKFKHRSAFDAALRCKRLPCPMRQVKNPNGK